jgi:hypothetical protein
MPQVDRLGTAATGFGVVGIGILAMGIGFGLAPTTAHLEGSSGEGQTFIGSPEAPVARKIVSGPLAKPMAGTQAGAVWFKGFRLDRVNEPFGLLRALEAHEASGKIACSPHVKGKSARELQRVNAIKCAGDGLNISASLVNARLASLTIQDGAGGEIVVIGAPHGMEARTVGFAAEK